MGLSSSQYHTRTGRPGGVSGVLELGIGQFREFEPRRVHTSQSINSLGHLLVNKLTCGKRESVS